MMTGKPCSLVKASASSQAPTAPGVPGTTETSFSIAGGSS
jgi:hypothetical protein